MRGADETAPALVSGQCRSRQRLEASAVREQEVAGLDGFAEVGFIVAKSAAREQDWVFDFVARIKKIPKEVHISLDEEPFVPYVTTPQAKHENLSLWNV